MTYALDKCTTMIKVYITEIAGVQVAWERRGEAIAEIIENADELAIGDEIIFSVDEMPKYEYEQLEEFEGY